MQSYSPSWARTRSNIGLEIEDLLNVRFTVFRSIVLTWKADGPNGRQMARARVAYQSFRRELGQEEMEAAWKAAKAGHERLWPLKAYTDAYRARYRHSPAQRRHQAKYQSKEEVKLRRAELARARRAARKAVAL